MNAKCSKIVLQKKIDKKVEMKTLHFEYYAIGNGSRQW